MITNNSNLPEFFVQAVKKVNSKYSKGKADFSVTQLIDSPYISKLKHEHAGEITEDVQDMIYRAEGHALHYIIEQAELEDSINEERLACELSGKTFSGCADVYYKNAIYDIKRCSVWSKVFSREQWEKQLNCYAYLYRKAGFKIDNVYILALYRDWSRRKAEHDKDYPQAQAETIEIQLWDIEKAEAFIQERIALHSADNPPACNKEERWSKPEKYAVMKKGRKSAVRLYDDLESAEALAGATEGGYIEHRSGEDTRCENFCSVSGFCEYWQNKLDG